MKTHPLTPRLAIVLTAFAGCIAGPLTAQTTPAKDETVVLSPFVITSRGDNAYKPSASTSAGLINQPIIDAPFTMTAITAQTLQDLQIFDMADIRNGSATLDQNSNGRGFGSEFNSRGFRTETLINGHRARQFMDNSLLEVVEIVNGPMATVYGEAGAGGVVALTTKTAVPGKRMGTLAFTAGDEHLRRGVVDLNVPLFGRSAARVIAYRSEMDSHIMRWFDRKKGAYFAVHTEPVAWLIVNAQADYLVYDLPDNNLNNIVRGTSSQFLDRNGNGAREFDFPNNYGAGPFYSATAFNALWRWKQATASGEAIATFSPQCSARFSALYENHDQDGINGWSTNDSFARTPKRVRIDQDRERETKSFKLDLLYQWDAPGAKLKGRLLGGAEFYRSSDRETYFEYQKPTAPLFIPWPPVATAASEYYLPSVDEIRRTWVLNGGIDRSRPYRDDSNQTRSQRIASMVDAFDGRLRFIAGYRLNEGAFKQNVSPINGAPYKWIPFDKDTYQYGVSGDLYKRIDRSSLFSRVTAYYSYGTTFIPPRQGNPPGLPDVQPEGGKGWDVGLKFEGLGGRLSGEVACFDLTRDNVLISTAPVGGGASYFINAGTQNGTGVQLALNFVPVAGWNIGVQYMNITGGVVYDSNPANIGLPLNSAKHKVTAQTRYEFRSGALKGLSAGASVRYTGAIPANLFSTAQRDWIMPGNTVFGVFGRYEFKLAEQRIGVSVTVDNLFDRLYLDRLGGANFVTGAPRNTKFTIDYKF